MRNLLLLILIVIVVWRLTKFVRRKRSSGAEGSSVTGQMVCCSQCGLYLPQSEALAERERYFCCEEHRDAYDPQR